MDGNAAFTSSLPRLEARLASRCTRDLFRFVRLLEDISQVSGNTDPLPRSGSRVICQQMLAYERVLDALTLAGLLRAGSVGECATTKCVSRLHVAERLLCRLLIRAQPQC